MEYVIIYELKFLVFDITTSLLLEKFNLFIVFVLGFKKALLRIT